MYTRANELSQDVETSHDITPLCAWTSKYQHPRNPPLEVGNVKSRFFAKKIHPFFTLIHIYTFQEQPFPPGGASGVGEIRVIWGWKSKSPTPQTH
jgi:hypothetical protein